MLAFQSKKNLSKCFTLHAMNLEYMKVSLFETLQKKKISLSGMKMVVLFNIFVET